MDQQQIKQLQIKIGSLKRNIKDIDYAEKELVKEQNRLVGYENEKDDDKAYRQKKVVDECQRMLPNLIQRLQTSVEGALVFEAELPPVPEPETVNVVAPAAAPVGTSDATPDKNKAEQGEGSSDPSADSLKDGDDKNEEAGAAAAAAAAGAGKKEKTTVSPGASTLNSSVNSLAGAVAITAEISAREQLQEGLQQAQLALKMRGVDVDITSRNKAGAAAGSAKSNAADAADDDY